MITTINEWVFSKNFKKNISKYTPDPINPKDMGPKDIFVFGSNTEGAHAGGAAKAAMNDYDAIWGQARGLQGRSYAIVTLDYTGKEPINTKTIEQEIITFLKFAEEHKDLIFWVTKIGVGISGYKITDIAPLFKNKKIPGNVKLPIEFI